MSVMDGSRSYILYTRRQLQGFNLANPKS